MDILIQFENALYGEGTVSEMIGTDFDYYVDRIIQFPSLRPLNIDKIVRICLEFCKNSQFRQLLLEKSVLKCPVLIHRLFKSGVYVFEEIEHFLQTDWSFIACFYYRKEIKSFAEFIEKKDIYRTDNYDKSYYEDIDDTELMVEYGFLPSSIEYCLKYDDIESLESISPSVNRNKNLIDLQGKWSPFEWSYIGEDLDLLSISGFFGSVKCFKHLMMNGCMINDSVKSLVVCSGNTDLFYICNKQTDDLSQHLLKASEYMHLHYISFLLEIGTDINSSNQNGTTPLHVACQRGNLNVAAYLISNGADIHKTDSSLY